MTCDTIVVSTTPNTPLTFDIEPTAFDSRLGAVITHNGRPLAFYSCTLNAAQQNYTTNDKIFLSLVATLTHFRSLLLGARLRVYSPSATPYLSLFPSQRLYRWCLLFDEFDCIFLSHTGPVYQVADALSREAASFVWKSLGDPTPPHHYYYSLHTIGSDQLNEADSFLLSSCDADADECPMEYPVLNEHAAMRHSFLCDAEVDECPHQQQSFLCDAEVDKCPPKQFNENAAMQHSFLCDAEVDECPPTNDAAMQLSSFSSLQSSSFGGLSDDEMNDFEFEIEADRFYQCTCNTKHYSALCYHQDSKPVGDTSGDDSDDDEFFDALQIPLDTTIDSLHRDRQPQSNARSKS